MHWLLLLSTILILLIVRVAASSKHPSPVELYGEGGRDILSNNVVSKQEIVACFFSICDITRDQHLDKIELNRCLTGKTSYLTTIEATLSNLNSYSLMRQCDIDKDNLISFDEAHNTNCIHVAQLEAMASKVCSRAQKSDLTYSEWRARYIAVKNVKSLTDAELMSFRLIDREVNPHRGDVDMRVGTPTDKQKKIGGKLTPELIIGVVYMIFAVIFIIVVSAIVFEITIDIGGSS